MLVAASVLVCLQFAVVAVLRCCLVGWMGGEAALAVRFRFSFSSPFWRGEEEGAGETKRSLFWRLCGAEEAVLWVDL